MPSSKTESIPIPYTETQKVEQDYDQMDASRLNQMYECATWKMYDRIMNARRAKAQRRQEQSWRMAYCEDQSEQTKAGAASESEKEQPKETEQTEQTEKPEQPRPSDQPSPGKRRMNYVSPEPFLSSSSASSSSAYFVGSLESSHEDDNRQELESATVRQTMTCAMAKQDLGCFGVLDTFQCQSDSDDDTKQGSQRSSFVDSEDEDELMFDLYL